MNAHWVKWVSVLSLALAGTLGVACGDDDDDDDDNGGSGGRSGQGGSNNGGSNNGGSNTGGSNTGGSGGGGGGVGGAGGGGLALPPTDVAALKTALDQGNYLPEIKAAKWACSNENDLGATEVPAHLAGQDAPATTRVCANFSLAGLDIDTTKNDAGWPLGAASVKETYDEDDNVVAIAYYALKADGTWFAATAEPVGDPQPPGAGREFEVTAGMNCGMCHTGENFVQEGNLVPRNGMLAEPNPYEAPLELASPPQRK